MRLILCCVVCVALAAASLLWADSQNSENRGTADMELSGGATGKVAFPHHRHQQALGDCNVCHAVFPQTKGAIEVLKGNGELKKMEVMNTLCIKCHKDRKKAQQKSGPTSCKLCHHKEG